MMESRVGGTFNVVGPAQPITMGDYLNTCKSVSQSNATFSWVDESFLLERQVAPWSELPVWVPEGDNGIQRTKIDKALAAGLTFRPLSDTVSAAMAWVQANPEKSSPQGTLT